MVKRLKTPFQYFGGKGPITGSVWQRFGSVRNYVEPFCGSAAMLLGRPVPFKGVETINDANAWVCNFFRSISNDPKGVVDGADYPVIELDMHARGDALFYRDDWYKERGYGSVEEWVEWLRGDESNYDPLIAGWWVWGHCAWIGGGWGREDVKCKRRKEGESVGIGHSMPTMATQGVHRKMPAMTSGVGIHRQQRKYLRKYITALSDRLHGVRVTCGDWSRICGPAPTISNGTTAVFLDPPYGGDDYVAVYGENESRTVAEGVRDWCMEWGSHPKMRIALCGYGVEHDDLLDLKPKWKKWDWKARGGYSNQRKDKEDANENCRMERVWFSPNCSNELPEGFMKNIDDAKTERNDER